MRKLSRRETRRVLAEAGRAGRARDMAEDISERARLYMPAQWDKSPTSTTSLLIGVIAIATAEAIEADAFARESRKRWWQFWRRA